MTMVYPEEHITLTYTQKPIYTIVTFYSMVNIERQEELLALTLPLFFFHCDCYTLFTHYKPCFGWTEVKFEIDHQYLHYLQHFHIPLC